MKRSNTWAWRMEGTAKFSPAAAVPVSTKMPDPIMAPIPKAVRLQGPSVFFSLISGRSDSAISLSMDLQHSSWLPLLSGSVFLGCVVVVSATRFLTRHHLLEHNP